MDGDQGRTEKIKCGRTLDGGGNSALHVLDYHILFLRRVFVEAFKVF